MIILYFVKPMKPTIPKRSVEPKDLFLILLGWAIHKILDKVWEKSSRNLRNRKRTWKLLNPFEVGDRLLRYSIVLLNGDPELSEWNLVDEYRASTHRNERHLWHGIFLLSEIIRRSIRST